MLAVDRGKYCHEINPYEDRPRQIGFNVTISAPHMVKKIFWYIALFQIKFFHNVFLPICQHAYALTFLTDQLFEGARALDVGSGSGYLTACMAQMVGNKGKVIGVEHISELVTKSITNVKSGNPEFLEDGRLQIVGNGFYTSSQIYIFVFHSRRNIWEFLRN